MTALTPSALLRQTALLGLDIPGLSEDAALADLADLARDAAGTPMALITVVDDQAAYSVAARGLAPRHDAVEDSLCAQVMHAAEPVVCEDLRRHPWYRDFPIVTGAERARAYAGVPIAVGNDTLVGALAVIDSKERHFSPAQLEALNKIARQINRLLDARAERLKGDAAAAPAQGLARFDLAQAIAGQSVWDWDLTEGKFADARTMATLLGYTPDEFKAQVDDWLDLLHPDDVERFTTALSQHLRGDSSSLAVEARQRHRDGQWIWLRIRGRVIERDARGMGTRMLGTMVDITDQRLMEDRIRDLNRELERQAQEAGDRARYRAQFLATMAHEIRTPLNGILGSAQLALMSAENEEQRVNLQLLMGASDYLTQLVNTVLDHSRLEARAVELERVPLCPADLLGEVMQRMRLQVAHKPVQLIAQAGHRLPNRILGDPLRLQQIIINLTSNAIKFTHQGHVTVSLDASEPKADRLILQVSDTGVGIEEHRQAALFSPFAQGGAAISRMHGGSGLGLAIVKQLVQLMGGSVDLQSEVNRGTTVTVNIPITPAADAQPASAGGTASMGTAPPDALSATVARLSTILQDRRVLVVDDNALNLRVVERVLRKAGLRVDVASSGQDGVQRAIESPYDVILMDLNMPDLDGLQATRRIRSALGDRTPKVLALSAAVSEAERLACNQAGMLAFLAKPIAPVEVLEALAGCMESAVPTGTQPGRRSD